MYERDSLDGRYVLVAIGAARVLSGVEFERVPYSERTGQFNQSSSGFVAAPGCITAIVIVTLVIFVIAAPVLCVTFFVALFVVLATTRTSRSFSVTAMCTLSASRARAWANTAVASSCLVDLFQRVGWQVNTSSFTVFKHTMIVVDTPSSSRSSSPTERVSTSPVRRDTSSSLSSSHETS